MVRGCLKNVPVRYLAKPFLSPSHHKPKLYGRLGHRSQKMVWGLFTLGKSPKVSVLEAESFRRRNNSTGMGKKLFSPNFVYTRPTLAWPNSNLLAMINSFRRSGKNARYGLNISLI